MPSIPYHYYLILAMFLWGGGWSALKIIAEHQPMEVIVFWRFFIMTLSFLPILYFIKEPIRLGKKNLTFIFGSTALNIGFMISSYFGVRYGSAGSAGVIITTLSPVMTFLLIALIFRKRLFNIQYFGLFIGVMGGVIMLELHNYQNFFLGANLYFLLCALLWAGVTMLSQHSQMYIHPVHYSFFISVVATFFTFFYGYKDNLLAVFDEGARFWSALIYLAVLGQSVATTIFYIASGRLGSERTSSFMFLVPLFALLVAYIFLDEPLEFHIVVGGTLSMVAVYFINKKEKANS
jgi:drug/metabolite transporter (DMT)-like permease